MESISDEVLDSFVRDNLGWIHIVERGIDRRMNREELVMLFDMVHLNGCENYATSQEELMNNVRIATTNFIEGIK